MNGYHYDVSGVDNVWLLDGYTLHETPYGTGRSIKRFDELTLVLVDRVMDKRARLSGREFRLIRNLLGLSQAELAAMHGVSEQSVSLWERHDRVPKASDGLLRLCWLIHRGDPEGAARLVARMKDDAPAAPQRIVARLTSRGWKAVIEDLPQDSRAEAA